MRVLHAADFHLDSPFANLTEEQARLRRQESRQLVDHMVDYANQHEAQLMLLAGDLFDSSTVYSETAQMLAESLGRFQGQVCIAPGNHDSYNAKSGYTKVLWPSNVHVFTDNKVQSIFLEDLDCMVYGAAFLEAEERDTLLLPVSSKEHLSLMVLHGDLYTKDSKYRYISKKQLEDSGMTYVALGHIHQGTDVLYAGKTAYAYSGCPEGHGFDETGDKGFLFGEIDRNGVRMHFVPFAKRRYYVLHVNVTGKNVIDAIDAQLPQATQEDNYRIILEGETDTPISVEKIQKYFVSRFYSLEWRNQTTITKDLWAEVGEDSLKGIFLRKLKTKYDQASTEEEKETICLAAQYGLAAMENRDF